jgi:LytS/YehU family sensor histidine kinase
MEKVRAKGLMKDLEFERAELERTRKQAEADLREARLREERDHAEAKRRETELARTKERAEKDRLSAQLKERQARLESERKDAQIERERYEKEQVKQALESERKERVINGMRRTAEHFEELALRGQHYTHMVSNVLCSFDELLQMGDLKGASRKLRKLEDLLRHELKNLRMEVVPLEQELSLVRRYARMRQEDHPGKFTFDIKNNPELDKKHLYVKPGLIQPLVENAITHGMLPKAGKGHIVVRCASGSDGLEILVADDGDPEAHHGNGAKGNGISTEVVERRAKLVGKYNSVNGRLERRRTAFGYEAKIIVPKITNPDAQE